MKMFIVAAILMASAAAETQVRILSEDSREVQEVFGGYSANKVDTKKNYCPHPEELTCPSYNKTLEHLYITDKDKELCCRVVDECLNVTVPECCCEDCIAPFGRPGECVETDEVSQWVFLYCYNYGTGEYEKPNWYQVELPTTCRCECEGHSCSASP